MTIDEKMLKEQLVTITEEVITAGNLQKRGPICFRLYHQRGSRWRHW